MKPLLLLDVDGPLNPHNGTNRPRQRAGYRQYRMRPDSWEGYRPLSVWLNAAHGPKLLDLADRAGLELVWATTWNEEANQWIAHRVGLPRLPVIEVNSAAVGWKYSAVDAYAADRPLAWLDDFDSPTALHADFMAARAGLPTLLHRVSSVVGLTDEDIDGRGPMGHRTTDPVTDEGRLDGHVQAGLH